MQQCSLCLVAVQLWYNQHNLGIKKAHSLQTPYSRYHAEFGHPATKSYLETKCTEIFAFAFLIKVVL